jgi:hypothetical protein
MTLLRGQARWVKMMSLWGKLTVPACHLTKFVNKAEYQTFLPTNIGINDHVPSIKDQSPGTRDQI